MGQSCFLWLIFVAMVFLNANVMLDPSLINIFFLDFTSHFRTLFDVLAFKPLFSFAFY